MKKFPGITSLYYVINPKANDTVYDLEHYLYYGNKTISEKLNGMTYKNGPKSFFQTPNPVQATALFRKAREMAELRGDEIVYDLYTGVGSIAIYLADSVKKVIGIETVPEAIEYAIMAKFYNITNAEFFAGDVKNILNDDFVNGHGKPDIIFTDPPRSGMELAVVQKILELAPEKIVYVSCNPATQARDIELMKDNYSLEVIQPVDMFPHTHHVENIAVLKKKDTSLL